MAVTPWDFAWQPFSMPFAAVRSTAGAVACRLLSPNRHHLRPRDPRHSRFLGNQITAPVDLHFADAMTERLGPAQLQTLFKTAFTRHLDKLETVVAHDRFDLDFDPGDSRRSCEIMGRVYRQLETRGAQGARGNLPFHPVEQYENAVTGFAILPLARDFTAISPAEEQKYGLFELIRKQTLYR